MSRRRSREAPPGRILHPKGAPADSGPDGDVPDIPLPFVLLEPGQDPSVLYELRPQVRLRRMKALLERAATHGDVDSKRVCAIREWLGQYRWETEMRQGRAPQRHEVNVSGSVTIVDSVSVVPPELEAKLMKALEAGAPVRALPARDGELVR